VLNPSLKLEESKVWVTMRLEDFCICVFIFTQSDPLAKYSLAAFSFFIQELPELLVAALPFGSFVSCSKCL
jgi:hypothetical protein